MNYLPAMCCAYAPEISTARDTQNVDRPKTSLVCKNVIVVAVCFVSVFVVLIVTGVTGVMGSCCCVTGGLERACAHERECFFSARVGSANTDVFIAK
jgi:hypothetical protein